MRNVFFTSCMYFCGMDGYRTDEMIITFSFKIINKNIGRISRINHSKPNI